MLLLFIGMRQEALRLGVMVGDPYPGSLIGMKHGGIQLSDRAILPQRPEAVGSQAHPGSDFRQLVVPRLVTEVTRADFRAHVPAVERRGGISDGTPLQA